MNINRNFLFLLLLIFIQTSNSLGLEICTYQVNQTSPGSCKGNIFGKVAVCSSIKAALNQGNAKCNAITINLLPGNYTGSSNTGINFQQYPNLLGLSIQGAGTKQTIIDALGSNYIFFTSQTNIPFSLAEVTLANGVNNNNLINEFDQSGGCISLNSAATISITNVDFYNCKTGQSESTFGGAVFLNSTKNSSIVLENLKFYYNSAGIGGALAIYSGVNVTLNNLLFHNNTVSYHGGGAYLGSRIRATNLIFENNFANSYGGGILFDAITPGTSSFSNITMISNTVGQNGGAIGVYNRTADQNVSFSFVSITNCSAQSGGAFYILNPNTVINDTTMTQNTAQLSGGAVYLNFTYSSEENCPLEIINTTISNNTAQIQGGGLFCREACAVLRGTIFDDNVASTTADSDNLYCDNQCQSSFCTTCPCDGSCNSCEYGCSMTGGSCSCLFASSLTDSYSLCPHSSSGLNTLEKVLIILAVLVIALVLGLLIGIMLLRWNRRRRIEEAMKESNLYNRFD